MATREEAYAALFALLQALPGVVTASRRVEHWADVPGQKQPAVYLAQSSERITRKPGYPAARTLNAFVYVYVKGASKAAPPSTKLNALVQAIETALEPVPGQETQTLGGRVYQCCIEGEIKEDEGALGDQAVAVIPVQMILP